MSFDETGQLIAGVSFAAVIMLALWFVQLLRRDAGIVDVGWAATIGILVAFYGISMKSHSQRVLLVVAMGTIWSFRLALYLLWDRILGKPEDGRYQQLRAGFGTGAPFVFLLLFEFQAVLAWLFSLDFWLAMRRAGPLDGWDLAGVIVWGVAIVGESVADAQLARFRNVESNRGRTCRSGLWYYSRHPNYFFEWIHWWSYVLVAWSAPRGWVTILAPLLMLFFLTKVTGIPTTEAQAVKSRGLDYLEYQRTTSMFVPWFPRAGRG